MGTDRIRMSGLVSGLDTETIVQALVSAASYKTTKLKNTQTKLEWKQEIWKSLNSEVYSLYTGKLDNLRYEGNYNAKKATLDNDIATVTADNNAVLGSQTLEVHQMATSGYLTGASFTTKEGGSVSSTSLFGDIVKDSDYTTEEKTRLASDGINIKVRVGKNAEAKDINIRLDDSMDAIADKFSKLGLNANFDAKTGRFFIASKSSGEDANFEVDYDASGESGQKILKDLGLAYSIDEETGEYGSVDGVTNGPVKIKGQNAKIRLNGADFDSSSNTFSVNGLNITVKGISEKDPSDPTKFKASTITTSVDVDTIYDSIKDFFKTYNELIKKMDTYYNAKANRDYDVLSEDEKEAMSDEEVEKWEKTIKDSLLRKDDNLSNLINLFKDGLSKNINLSDANGNTTSYSLSSFGINTLGYFEAGENEHGLYHIDGDSDDESTKSKDDSLKKMIASNPEAVSGFFSQLFKGMYQGLNKEMRFIEETRSAMKVYDDKVLQKEYDKLTSDIKKQEEKVTEMEDHYYSKFTAMEKALSKMNAQSSSFASMLGQ